MAPARAAALLTVVCAAQFMVVLDISVVNVALPSIRTSLGFSDTGLAWVVNAYALVFAGLLLVGGRLADVFGRKRVFLAGLLLFTVASLVGGLASTPGWLIGAFLVLGLVAHPAPVFAASALFGIGNGLLLPVITVLIGETPPATRRGQATSLSGTAMFTGQFGSPLVFGPLMAATSITTGYLLAAAIAATILAGLFLIRIDDPTGKHASYGGEQSGHAEDSQERVVSKSVNSSA
ncbi:MFS transporter [Nocardia sp. NPDC004415]